MLDDDALPLTRGDQQFVLNALDVVKLKFPHTKEEFNDPDRLKECPIEFAHQIFGDTETIFGYQDLEVSLLYTPASLCVFPHISFSRTSTQGGSDVAPDCIFTLLKDATNSHVLESKDSFYKKLAEDQIFKPSSILGEPIAKFEVKLPADDLEIERSRIHVKENEPAAKRSRIDDIEYNFELYKSSSKEHNEGLQNLLTQLQSLAFWYIDGVNYTDNTDDRWLHYILFQTLEVENGQKYYAVAGYASLYRFYHYKEQERIRIAHFLLVPNYRGKGLGPIFLDHLYKDLQSHSNLYDITVEEPSENMRNLRDFVDCKNCLTLEQFKDVRKGYTFEMEEVARQRFKIYSKQARRVYEILHYAMLEKGSKDELKAYRLDVKRRLEKPFKRRDKEWKKLANQLEPDELRAHEMTPETKKEHLSQLFEDAMKEYQVIIDRLRKENLLP